MSVQWGIGIEHELLSYQYGDPLLGSTILEKLEGDSYGIRSYIKQFLVPTSYYPSYIWYNLPSYIVRDDPQRMWKLQLRERLHSNSLPDHIRTALVDYLIAYQGLLNDELPDRRLVDLFIDTLDADSINSGAVVEFKTRVWQNQNIADSVQQVSVEQYLVLVLANFAIEATSSPIYYAKYGSIFPLVNPRSDRHSLDYTGSYHLNLSLPYDVETLRTEQDQYMEVTNWVKRDFQDAVEKLRDTHSEWYGLFQRENVLDSILHDLPLVAEKLDAQTLRYFHQTYDKKIQQFMNPAITQIIDQDKAPLSDFSFRILVKDRGAVLGCYHYNPSSNMAIFLENVKINESTPENIMSLYRQCHQVLQLPEFAGKQSWHNNMMIRFVKDGVFIRPRILKGGLEPHEQHIPLHLPHTPPDLEPLVIHMIDLLKKYIEKSLNNNLKYVFNEINTFVNLQTKYQISNFHHLHKQWAIGIQWVMPLLLSCYSSCDPFSIGDGNRLSELSLRLFISGFNFINQSNIKQYQLSDERELLPWQKKNNLYQNSERQFSYRGSPPEAGEFRVDERQHGFQFGFELRVFDNFDIIHLDTLLEFLFLVADQVAHADYPYTKNPFTSEILNNSTFQILKQGWNTTITSKYRKLLNEQLQLRIPTTGEMTSYEVINHIYHQLQREYLDLATGKGMGIYTKHLVKRPASVQGLQDLPNINRESWEHHFVNLVWNPTPPTPTRKIIESAILRAPSQSHLYQLLHDELHEGFQDDIWDIIYTLESIGIKL